MADGRNLPLVLKPQEELRRQEGGGGCPGAQRAEKGGGVKVQKAGSEKRTLPSYHSGGSEGSQRDGKTFLASEQSFLPGYKVNSLIINSACLLRGEFGWGLRWSGAKAAREAGILQLLSSLCDQPFQRARLLCSEAPGDGSW